MPTDYKNYFKDRHGKDGFLREAGIHTQFLFNQLKLIKNKLGENIFQDKNTLEIGSGLGSLAMLLLKEKAASYKGIDLDSNAVEFCNQNIGNYFEQVSFEKLEISRKFDLVLAFEVLEHLENPKAAVRKIHELLGGKGVFVGTSPFPFKKNILADKTHVYCLHPENWKKLFLENGFSEARTFPMTFFPCLWRIHKNLNPRIPIYLPFKYFISTSLIIACKS